MTNKSLFIIFFAYIHNMYNIYIYIYIYIYISIIKKQKKKWKKAWDRYKNLSGEEEKGKLNMWEIIT